jgi:hypothetical protein
LNGILAAALLPVFFLNSTEVVLLLVQFLLSFQAGGLVLAAAGIQRVWLSYAGTVTGVMVLGWLWRGGALVM